MAEHPDSRHPDLQWPALRASRSLLLPGEAGDVEVQLSSPTQARQPRTGLLVCHPHPLYGGAMSNKVVHALASAGHDAGLHVLRFNFRGVGRSEGVHDNGRGEADDVVALAELLRGPLQCERLVLAGFSFGGFVAVAAYDRIRPDALVTVAPALRYLDGGKVPGWPERPACPWLVIHGDDDDVVPQSDTLDALSDPPARVRIERPTGTGHFFHGRLEVVREPAAVFMSEVLD